MPKHTYILYLQDIIESIEKIQIFTEKMDFDHFRFDARTIDAIVRNIEIIGEATKHLPETIRREYPLVPWKQIEGTRNKLIHEYFGIDLEIIWKTILEDLPKLKEQVKIITEAKENT